MKIAYVSNLISKKTLAEVYGFGSDTPGQQAQKYNRLLSQGLSAFCDIKNVSFPACTRRTTKNLSLTLPAEQSGGLDFQYLKAINFPIVKNLSAMSQSRRVVKSFDAVVCDLCCASASHGALRYAKQNKIPAIGIITDLPEYLSGGAGSAAFKKLFAKNLRLCDGFVLMTEQMAEKPGIKGKPYVVIEGLCEKIGETPKPPQDKKIVIYAGGLEEEYNVDRLVDAFISVGIGELWLYGNGSLAESIRKISENNPSVKYFGVVANDVVVRAEAEATLLVNPRLPTGEFTKYSFPSKNMEYMSSGTPLLCYMLPGMPKEYEKYVISIGENLEKSLRGALEKSPAELREIGLSAQNFVLENKNCQVQASRLI